MYILKMYILSIEMLAIISAALFIFISVVFARIYVVLRSGFSWIKLSIAFLLLGVSQVFLFVGLVYERAGVSYALYTTSPALAFSGAYLIWSVQRRSRLENIELLSIFLLLRSLPAILDLLAALMLILVSIESRGFVRLGSLILAIAYILRSLWLVVPGLYLEIYVLLTAEITRSLGALVMTIFYARRLLA